MAGDLHRHDLLGPAPTLLPDDPATTLLAAGSASVGELRAVAAQHPASPLAWAVLAEEALADGRTVEGYAYARTGYHRSLDALRKSGWRGQGEVPWEHEPNRGFLRALAALARAAGTIGEDDEAQRCRQFLHDSSVEGAQALGF